MTMVGFAMRFWRSPWKFEAGRGKVDTKRTGGKCPDRGRATPIRSTFARSRGPDQSDSTLPAFKEYLVGSIQDAPIVL
jgi:hypothetical protein